MSRSANLLARGAISPYARAPMAHAYIAIGSNLGQRQDAIRLALARLEELPGATVTAISDFRETEPVDAPSGSGPFINGAIAILTDLEPLELLRHLLQLEREMGRDRIEINAKNGTPTPQQVVS